MRRLNATRSRIIAVAVIMAAGAWAAGSPAASAHPAKQVHDTGTLNRSADESEAGHPVSRACAQPRNPAYAACLTLVRTDVAGHDGLFRRGVTAQAAPSGFGAADLQSAYNLPSASAGTGATVAVVDANDDPKAEADLAVYRSQYGLPACTTANGCFEKVNQQGQQGSYPPSDSGWAVEESLDIDMISAICPNCRILLVEANTPNIDDLGASVDEAVALGAKYVSNSYGSQDSTGGPFEPPEEATYDHYYDHPGVVVTASAGDNAYGVNYPSGSQYVTAVGGTSLSRDTGTARGWTERVWTDSGSGCSAYEAKPAWQTDAGCANRTTADVSAVADPQTGVALYDTYNKNGWLVAGGTSVSAPIIASTYALAGLPAADSYPARYPYDAVLAGSTLNDVVAGSDGSCDPAYLCTAGPGFDGPTGWGTPDGTAAFKARDLGTVAGKVTDATSGAPVGGAQVSVPGMSVTTGSDGAFSLELPAASYQLTVSDYGYQSQTQSVTVTGGQSVTANVSLTGTPHVAVAGTVTAGDGTPWPLYAKVAWSDGDGHSGSTYTTPGTGKYSLSLVENGSYTLNVSPLYPGYKSATKQVSAGADSVTADVRLPVDLLACTAIGYHPVDTGTAQAFTSTRAPRGWQVRDVDLRYPGYSSTPGWSFANPGGRVNQTGGSGNFAIVDSDHYGAHHYQDTYLTSPLVRLDSAKTPVVSFGTDLAPAVNSAATVQLSVDGGRSWSTIWRNASFPGSPGPATVRVAVPQAAGKSAVQVRFWYLGEWSAYWAIDNVFVGQRDCDEVPGSLLTGRVADGSGAALDGATVTGAGGSAVTVATPGDTGVNGGLYWLFSADTGSQQVTASMTGFGSAAKTVTLTAGEVSALNFTLSASG